MGLTHCPKCGWNKNMATECPKCDTPLVSFMEDPDETPPKEDKGLPEKQW